MTNLDEVRKRQWFYKFGLPDGTYTATYVPADVATIHDARLEMVRRVVRDTFGEDLSAVDAIDFACHQGWFTAKMLDDGVRSVRAVDIRPEHLDDAALITSVLGHDKPRTSFQRFDVDGVPNGEGIRGQVFFVPPAGLRRRPVSGA